MSQPRRTIVMRLMTLMLLSSLALTCKQYEYNSPDPGILEVRLRVLNSREDLMPFSPTSFYQLLLKELNVTAGSVTQPIYADLNAFRRTPDGDPFNALDISGRDSTLVLGQAYVPPMNFLGLNMTMVCGSMVQVFRNAIPIPNSIEVNPPPFPAPPVGTFFRFPEPPQTREIPIRESRRTIVTITFDMDSSLVRRSEDFELHPYFYISSVKED